jgi:hypothetical protein
LQVLQRTHLKPLTHFTTSGHVFIVTAPRGGFGLLTAIALLATISNRSAFLLLTIITNHSVCASSDRLVGGGLEDNFGFICKLEKSKVPNLDLKEAPYGTVSTSNPV